MGCNRFLHSPCPGFLFVAMAVVAALFASAGYDVMEDEQNKKRQESISKTTNKRK